MRNSTFFLAGVLMIMAQSICAQQADPDQFIDRVNSPYSIYGIGDLMDQGFAYHRGLGGVSSAFKSPFNINPQNPATYSDFFITNLEFGFHANARNLRTLTDQLNASDSNLSYMSLGFPIAKNLGFAGGFIPMSKVSYSIATDDVGELGPERIQYTGKGDVNRAFVGLGYAYGNENYGISIGFNYNLIFGKVDRTVDTYLTDEPSFLWTRRRNERKYTGDFLQYGVQFTLRPKPESDFVIIASLAGDVETNVNVDLGEVWERTAGGGLELEVSRSDSNEEVKLPGRIAAGLSIQNASGWALGLEIEKEAWSEYSGFQLGNSYKDATRYALGFMITPDTKAFNNYLKTIQYRAGVYYNNGFLSLSGNDISEIGITFGLGLPVRRNSTRLPNYSRLNLSFDIGQRGTTDSGLIQENYIKTTFGFTLNDRWFVKKKYD